MSNQDKTSERLAALVAGPGEGAPRRALTPEPAASPRRFTRSHLRAVAVATVLCLVVAVYVVLRARDVPDAVPLAPTATELEPAPSPSPSVRMLVVHVAGAVRQPGLVNLPDGSRVADAITAAGGPTEHAQLGTLNLAQPVQDGQQILVSDNDQEESRVGAGGGSGSGGSGGPGGGGPGGKINLNTATAAELETLPGVGPATSARIIAWREEHGRFTSVEELQEVSGIGPKTFEQLAEHVTV
ncbi:helix-hairpin-helix domain-containing protein [Parenemella sanctibonifatiensis]|uniref:helix-hairpin-helix domain-containing protein n=1 Tax=Parenemella sanctibonifatiensis TaxID=2016505 RepID=UPI001E381709|nr:helix-hairpin-helix domain-containing protein [Parenemella sanctibonifatiensis]